MGYAVTGVAGELMQISNGVGYTQPFEIVGMPGIDGEKFAESLCSWLKRVLSLGRTLRLAKVRNDYYLRALVDQVFDGWYGCDDTSVVGDSVAVKWHVQVATDYDPLAVKGGEFGELAH